MRNRHHTASTAAYRFGWRVEDGGVLVAEGDLAVAAVPAGGSGYARFPPALLDATDQEPDEERWLTVTASLAVDTPWARAGHEVAFAQAQLGRPDPEKKLRPPPGLDIGATAARTGQVTLGCAVLDAGTGELRWLGPYPVHAAALDFWRAPTDNDVPTVAGAWRRAGLDRLVRKTLAVQCGEDGLCLWQRIAPAGGDFGFLASLTWTADGMLFIQVAPDGTWPCPLPKIGLRLVLDAAVAEVTWFGRGPGEAYRDTNSATRVGWFSLPVASLATPYVRPQENGNRMHARRLSLSGPSGQGLAVTGYPHVDFTVRPWSPEALTAARHTPDLVPDGRTYVHLDATHHGIGSGSCGPPPQPGHSLAAHAVDLTLGFTA